MFIIYAVALISIYGAIHAACRWAYYRAFGSVKQRSVIWGYAGALIGAALVLVSTAANAIADSTNLFWDWQFPIVFCVFSFGGFAVFFTVVFVVGSVDEALAPTEEEIQSKCHHDFEYWRHSGEHHFSSGYICRKCGKSK